MERKRWAGLGRLLWVIRAGNYLVSRHPFDSGKPPKAPRPSPPPSRVPLLALQPPEAPPPSRLSFRPSGRSPPPPRVPILCEPPHPSRDPVCSLAWALPHPGSLSTIWFPPTSQGPLHPPGPASLWAPSTLWDPFCPPGTPPRALSAHVGPVGAGERGDRAGVPLDVEERGIHLLFPCPGPWGSSWGPGPYPLHSKAMGHEDPFCIVLCILVTFS